MMEESSITEPGRALTTSFSSDGLDLVIEAGDVGLDALITSGALDGIPILGLLHGLYKTARNIPALLYQRKVARLLAAVAQGSSAEERRKFADDVRDRGEAERLGETILLLLDRADEVDKPWLIGRIVAAHIRGELERVQAFRICATINRVYYPDLELLKSFRWGTGAPNQFLFATLAAVGLLSGAGWDGGIVGSDDPNLAGGDIYIINEQGVALLVFGFGMTVDVAAEVAEAEQAQHDAQQRYIEEHTAR